MACLAYLIAMIAVENKPASKVWTDEEILNLPHDSYTYEVVDGELVMSPKNNPQHGNICVRISARLLDYADARNLGQVFDSNTGYWMVNRNLRAPDVSFLASGRLPKGSATAFFHGAPDLVVEVLSPTNTRRELDERLRDFFESGTKLAWVIDPEERCAEVCRSPIDRRMVGPGGILEGENVLPGFKLPLADLFRGWE
jgi:Uma2 family endonuclease